MTAAQAKLLHYIRMYQRRHHGVTPSYAEMCTHMGVTSKHGIHKHVTRLRERGYIAHRYNAKREIEIIKLPAHQRRIPREARV